MKTSLPRLAKQLIALSVSLALSSWGPVSIARAAGVVLGTPAGAPSLNSAGAAGASLGSENFQIAAPVYSIVIDPTTGNPGLTPFTVPSALSDLPQAPGLQNLAIPVSEGLQSAISQPMLSPVAASGEYARAVGESLQASQSPVLKVNGLLQEAGASGAAQQSRPAAAFEAVAEALPQGSPLSATLRAFAGVLSRGGGAARRYELDRAWEDVSARYRTEALLPKESVPEGQEARLTDLSALRVPEGRLRWAPDAALIPESTESIPGDKDLFLGQKQGVRSLIRGLRLSGNDANVFVTGDDSVGKVKAAAKEAHRLASDMPRPEDLVQVPDLKGEGDPLFLRLSAGSGKRFVAAAEGLLEAMQESLPEVIGELKLAEMEKGVVAQLLAKIEPQAAALRAEIAAVELKGGFRMKMVVESGPGTFSNGIRLVTADGTLIDDGEHLTALLKDKGGLTAAEVHKDFEEKANGFRPKMAEVYSPFLQGFKLLHQQLAQQRQQAVNAAIEAAAEPLLRIAKRMAAAANHNDEAHRLLKERFERLGQEAESALEARQAAWEAKLPQFEVEGFGLQLVEVPMRVNMGGMVLMVPSKQLTVTYKGKPLASPETIAALREDGYVPPAEAQAEQAQGEPQAAPAPAAAEQAEQAPQGAQGGAMDQALKQALAGIVSQVMEAAQPLLDEQRQIKEDMQDQTSELEARMEEEHEAIHEGDNAYQVMKWVHRFIGSLQANFGEFLPGQGGPGGGRSAMLRQMAEQMGLNLGGATSDPKENYRVKLLVDNARTHGAPVIVPKEYSWRAMFGSVETTRRLIMGPNGPMGVAKKDPRGPDIEAGYLQKADKGFLILEVEKLFRYPDVAHAFFDMIERGEAEFTEEGILSILYDRSARYPLPVNVKVILTGPPIFLHLLRHYVPQFATVFTMVAEFENAMYTGGQQAAETVAGYLTFMRNIVDRYALKHFDKGAISRVLEHAARQADSNEKIALTLKPMERLMREASLYASDAGRAQVSREDVEKAIVETMESESLYRDVLYNLIADQTFWVNVEGKKKDTITGMAVIGAGEGFGIPSRISVETYAAKAGEIVASTEKDAKLVGSSFEQSVGNVMGFFQGMLGKVHLLPFQARVKFEQNYGGIDGDSATQTMIYLIGASLADAAINQNFAITGSADQHGNVQAIGGINHKVEGAWDVFVEMRRRAGRGLSKDEPYNVIFPASNIRELALRPDVAQAVKDGYLNLIPVVHVSQGFELLTGVPYAKLVAAWRSYRERIVETNREKKDEARAPAQPGS